MTLLAVVAAVAPAAGVPELAEEEDVVEVEEVVEVLDVAGAVVAADEELEAGDAPGDARRQESDPGAKGDQTQRGPAAHRPAYNL